MKAKLITRQIILDYTSVAEPMTLEYIARDIGEVRSSSLEDPEVIVLWEHQWDWLTKDVDNSGRLFERDNQAVGYKALYGIPVRIANV